MSVHAIEEIVKKLDEAFGHSGLEAVLGFYEDDAILVAEPDRLARGKEEIERFFMHVFALRGRVEQIETNVLEAGGGIALFTSRWRFIGTMSDGTPIEKESIATSVFRGRDGLWRMAIDNSHGPAILTKASA